MKSTYLPSEGKELYEDLVEDGMNFISGLPCSNFKSFLQELSNHSEIPYVKIVNEAQAVGVAFGAWLSGKKAAIYLQESGIPYTLNPIATLLIPANCYDIKFIISRRTKPYQHTVLGNCVESMMNLIGYKNYIFVEEQ